MTLTLVLLAIGNMLLLVAIRSLRLQRLKVRYALLFLFLGPPFFALAAWPDAVGSLAAILGIEYQTVLLLTVTTFFLFMNFTLLSIVSSQEQRITCLAQKVGILEHTQRSDMARESSSAEAPLRLEGPGRSVGDVTLKRGA